MPLFTADNLNKEWAWDSSCEFCSLGSIYFIKKPSLIRVTMDPELRSDGNFIPNNCRVTEGQFETALCIICCFDSAEIVLLDNICNRAL